MIDPTDLVLEELACPEDALHGLIVRDGSFKHDIYKEVCNERPRFHWDKDQHGAFIENSTCTRPKGHDGAHHAHGRYRGTGDGKSVCIQKWKDTDGS